MILSLSSSNASNAATPLDAPSAPSIVLLVLVEPRLSMDLRRSERTTTGDYQFDSSSTCDGSRSSDPTTTSKSTTTIRLRSMVFPRRSRQEKSFVFTSIESDRFNRMSTPTSTNGSLRRWTKPTKSIAFSTRMIPFPNAGVKNVPRFSACLSPSKNRCDSTDFTMPRAFSPERISSAKTRHEQWNTWFKQEPSFSATPMSAKDACGSKRRLTTKNLINQRWRIFSS